MADDDKFTRKELHKPKNRPDIKKGEPENYSKVGDYFVGGQCRECGFVGAEDQFRGCCPNCGSELPLVYIPVRWVERMVDGKKVQYLELR